MSSVTVVNVRGNYKPPTGFFSWGESVFFYVGRANRQWPGSPLANPYKLSMPKGASRREKEAERLRVVSLYADWLSQALAPGSEQDREIERFVYQCLSANEVLLGCWCAPALCHADVIAHEVLSRCGYEDEASASKWGRILAERKPVALEPVQMALAF